MDDYYFHSKNLFLENLTLGERIDEMKSYVYDSDGMINDYLYSLENCIEKTKLTLKNEISIVEKINETDNEYNMKYDYINKMELLIEGLDEIHRKTCFNCSVVELNDLR